MFDSDESEIGRKLSVYSSDHKSNIELQAEITRLEDELEQAEMGLTEDSTRPHDNPSQCHTYYDGCHCSVQVLLFNIARAEKAEAKNITLQRIIDLGADRIKLLESNATCGCGDMFNDNHKGICPNCLMVEAFPSHQGCVIKVKELNETIDRLRRERIEYSTVLTTEGMNASEWIWRTGKAEAKVKELIERLAEAAQEHTKNRTILQGRISELEDALSMRCASNELRIKELEEALRTSSEYHRMHCECDGNGDEEFTCAQHGLEVCLKALNLK